MLLVDHGQLSDYDRLLWIGMSYPAVKGSMRTTARTPTAWAKRWTVRMDGVPLPLSMRATTL
jgi:hypothetical protein